MKLAKRWARFKTYGSENFKTLLLLQIAAEGFKRLVIFFPMVPTKATCEFKSQAYIIMLKKT